MTEKCTRSMPPGLVPELVETQIHNIHKGIANLQAAFRDTLDWHGCALNQAEDLSELTEKVAVAAQEQSANNTCELQSANNYGNNAHFNRSGTSDSTCNNNNNADICHFEKSGADTTTTAGTEKTGSTFMPQSRVCSQKNGRTGSDLSSTVNSFGTKDNSVCGKISTVEVNGMLEMDFDNRLNNLLINTDNSFMTVLSKNSANLAESLAQNVVSGISKNCGNDNFSQSSPSRGSHSAAKKASEAKKSSKMTSAQLKSKIETLLKEAYSKDECSLQMESVGVKTLSEIKTLLADMHRYHQDMRVSALSDASLAIPEIRKVNKRLRNRHLALDQTVKKSGNWSQVLAEMTNTNSNNGHTNSSSNNSNSHNNGNAGNQNATKSLDEMMKELEAEEKALNANGNGGGNKKKKKKK